MIHTEVIAALREVTKAYPGTLAAQNITIEFRRGEIHGLVGENGAGKSTLVKIIAGLIQPDHGYVEVEGKPQRFANPRASLMAGIGVVHQAGTLIDTLTVGENIELSKLYAKELSPRPDSVKQNFVLPNDISLHSKVNTLTMRQRQLVEIHRLMLQQAQLLVLDEPTATLTRQESALLFRDLERLANAGYGIVVISHKLPELISHCHTFTVLRKGRMVGTLNPAEASVAKLIQLCSGSNELSDAAASAKRSESNVKTAPALVQLKGVTTACAGEEPLCDLNLTLRPGEIVGVAGRPGSGAATLLRILRNESVPADAGSVEWDEAALEKLRDCVIGYVPAGRTVQGVILDFTIAQNLKLRQRNYLSWIGGHAHRQEQRQFVQSLISEFDIRPPNPNQTLRNLSGGNVQKVLLAREMKNSQVMLVVESPTAGLDTSAAVFVRRLLRQKANDGACVIIHSDDLDELAEACDRVVVLVDGTVVRELIADEISPDAIGLALSEVTLVDRALARAAPVPSEVICAD